MTSFRAHVGTSVLLPRSAGGSGTAPSQLAHPSHRRRGLCWGGRPAVPCICACACTGEVWVARSVAPAETVSYRPLGAGRVMGQRASRFAGRPADSADRTNAATVDASVGLVSYKTTYLRNWWALFRVLLCNRLSAANIHRPYYFVFINKRTLFLVKNKKEQHRCASKF